eukprot:6180974-Pleurochrysis_carterae.AAC.2
MMRGPFRSQTLDSSPSHHLFAGAFELAPRGLVHVQRSLLVVVEFIRVIPIVLEIVAVIRTELDEPPKLLLGHGVVVGQVVDAVVIFGGASAE